MKDRAAPKDRAMPKIRWGWQYASPAFYRKVYKTAGKSEILLIIDIIQDTLPDVVVDANTLLLKHAIIADCINLQAGRQRDRSKRAMRRQCHIA